MPLSVDEVGNRLKSAMENADLDGLFALLAPDVRWGPPDDPVSGCHNRDEVRAWYQAAFEGGVRAKVNEVVATNDRLLVGLAVSTTGAPVGPVAERWQVLTVRDGLIADIRGFETRDDAAHRAGVTQ
jgi:ketosteroid isomerase-like protein